MFNDRLNGFVNSFLYVGFIGCIIAAIVLGSAETDFTIAAWSMFGFSIVFIILLLIHTSAIGRNRIRSETETRAVQEEHLSKCCDHTPVLTASKFNVVLACAKCDTQENLGVRAALTDIVDAYSEHANREIRR